MITEGIAREISPELIRAIVTFIPILVAGWWMLYALGSLWRHAIWEEIGGAVERMAERTGGSIRPRWAGWRVDAGDLRVDWVGGLMGPRTIVKKAAKVDRFSRLLTSDELDLHR